MPKKSPKLPVPAAAGDLPIDGNALPMDRIVRSRVMAALGHPPGLYEVTVRPLWENHYRVNVLIGPDVTSVRIAHSYFVEAGDNGDILSATPKIVRQYT